MTGQGLGAVLLMASALQGQRHPGGCPGCFAQHFAGSLPRVPQKGCPFPHAHDPLVPPCMSRFLRADAFSELPDDGSCVDDGAQPLAPLASADSAEGSDAAFEHAPMLVRDCVAIASQQRQRLRLVIGMVPDLDDPKVWGDPPASCCMRAVPTCMAPNLTPSGLPLVRAPPPCHPPPCLPFDFRINAAQTIRTPPPPGAGANAQ